VKDKREREGWVDAARGTAIVLVVLGHVIHIVEREFSVVMPGMDVLDRVLYSFHVPVFFFLSGLFFAGSGSGRSGLSLLGQRARRLLYPYLVWSVLQTAVEVVTQQGWQQRLAPQLLQIIYFPQAHFWFLYVLFFCGAIGIALRGILVSERRTVWTMLVLSLIWYAVHPLLPGGPIKDIGLYLPYFALGYLWSEFGRVKVGSRCDLTGVIAVCGLFVCSVMLAVANNSETDVLVRLPIGILGVAAVCSLSYAVCLSLKVPLLRYIGRYSLSIYLIHVLAIHALFMFVHDISAPLAIVAAMVVGIGLPLAFRDICSRLRVGRLFGV